VPEQIEMSVGNIEPCDTTKFYYCIYLHAIRWAVYRVRNFARDDVLGFLTSSMPLSAPTSDVVYNNYLYGNK
jgi:hypothetical protein